MNYALLSSHPAGADRTPACALHTGLRRHALMCLCLLLAAALAPATLRAQATKIFVASFGSDTNDGSRGSPKRNFQAAHDAVATGGEVVALDTAGYGTLNITKNVGVTAPAGITGFVTVSSGTGIIVNAGNNGVVTLRGLTINSPNGTLYGINVLGGGTLEVNGCVINGFSIGINFDPPSSGTLLVKNSTLRDNSSNGILLPSSAGIALKVAIDGCRLQSNRAGLSLDGALGGVAHRVLLRDTVITDSQTAAVEVDDNNIRVALSGCTLTANGTAINLNQGVGNVDNCLIAGNTTGLIRGAAAPLLSRGNNTLADNGTDGVFNNTYPAK